MPAQAAHLGIANTFGLAAPEGGYAHETSRKSAVDVVSTKNDQGVTVFADPKPFVKREITMKGVGAANFGLVTPGGFAAGELKIISAKGMEENEKRPEFEYHAELFENR